MDDSYGHDQVLRITVPITDEEHAHSRNGSLDRLLDHNPIGVDDNGAPPPESLAPEPVHGVAFRDGAPHQHHVQSLYDPPSRLDNVSPINEEPPQPFISPEEPHQRTRAGYAPVQQLPQLWRPFWLHELVLAAFVVTFALLLAGCLVIWHMTKVDNGFAIAKSTSHLTWTYAPTAVLVILVGLWRQVDYHCKALTPWAELRKGPVTASRSILLDYTSPLQISAFVKASQNGHWAVLASIFAFALLKLMVSQRTCLRDLSRLTSSDHFRYGAIYGVSHECIRHQCLGGTITNRANLAMAPSIWLCSSLKTPATLVPWLPC
jgi:hypothetical protein